MPIKVEAKQGDCIYSIAAKAGVLPEAIWNQPDNAALKKKGRTPSQLQPGDVVVVPERRERSVTKPVDQRHTFRRKAVPRVLRLRVMDFDVPSADAAYCMTVDGVTGEGKTDKNGWLIHPIAPNAQKASILFADGSESELLLGQLDPVGEVSGVQARLQSLSVYLGPVDNQLSDSTREALARFQRAQGLEATGAIDDATTKKLQQLTGHAD